MARICVLLAVAAVTLLVVRAQEVEEVDSDEQTQRTLNNLQCPKPGLCPYVKRLLPASHHEHHYQRKPYVEPPSLCGNLCVDDKGCPGTTKCCPTNCGYSCNEPVHIK